MQLCDSPLKLNISLRITQTAAHSCNLLAPSTGQVPPGGRPLSWIHSSTEGCLGHIQALLLLGSPEHS